MICIDMSSYETHLTVTTSKDDPGFWDSWSKAEKVAAILGYVGFAFSAITILVGFLKFHWYQKIRGWLGKRRSRAVIENGTPDGPGAGTNNGSDVGNGIPTGSGTGTEDSSGSRIYTPDASGTVTGDSFESLKGGLAIKKTSDGSESSKGGLAIEKIS